MQNKAWFIRLPTSFPLAGAVYLGSYGCSLKIGLDAAQNLLARGGGSVGEMQNKADAQPAWMQLAAGA